MIIRSTLKTNLYTEILERYFDDGYFDGIEEEQVKKKEDMER